MKNIRKIIKYLFGYDNEYTKREMSLCTRIVLILLLEIIPLFTVLFVAHMKFGLSATLTKIFWTNYLTFCRWLITGYFAAWIGQMGKAFLAKREEENLKLKRELHNLTGKDYEESDDESDEEEYDEESEE